MRSSVNTPDAPHPIGPYSQAVRHNDLLWISGQLGMDASSGELVPGGTTAQTEQVLRNLDAICRDGDTSLSKALRVTIYLVDLAEFAAVNEVYRLWFDEEPFPARACVQVAALPKGGRVEMDAVVAVESGVSI